MGKRLSKIYTKTGDRGETGLGNGNRIAKDHPRVEAIGDVDELNSAVGMLIEEILAESDADLTEIAEFLRGCQHRIFDLGGELSMPGFQIVNADHVKRIETELDRLNEALDPLENFILPGGSRLMATCHWTRSVCRRAERRMVSLADEETINEEGLKFVNRLSDYLFVAARTTGKHRGVPEVLWHKDQES